MHREVREELTYVLLVELLAYQFASPVRWIETQDVFLGAPDVETFIEIGPSDTLVSMAKKTIASKFKDQDSALSTKRKLLAYKNHAKEIRYDVDDDAEDLEVSVEQGRISKKETTPASSKASKTTASENVPIASNSSLQDIAVAAPSVAASQICDCPPKAIEIVTAIVAQKLKKAFHEVDMQKSIKQSVGGRSTLENEIVGDMAAAFGSLPERAEELEMESLCAQLQSLGSASDSLTKSINTLIGRTFSLKMPGGFGVAAARKHLEGRWGLGQGRQTSVFLRASTVQPATRLASTCDAVAFFDGIAQKYLMDNNLNHSAGNNSSQNPAAGEAARSLMVDAKSAPTITLETTASIWAKLEKKARFLGIDMHAGDRVRAKNQNESDELRRGLDRLNAELGPVFITGIQPSWAAAKARHFDSYWNWAAQDVLDLVQSMLLGRTIPEDLATRKSLIVNRSDKRLIQMLRYLHDTEWPLQGRNVSQVREFVVSLLVQCEAAANLQLPLVPYIDIQELQKMPQTSIDSNGDVRYREVPRSVAGLGQGLTLQTKTSSGWSRNDYLTKLYEKVLHEAQNYGYSFQNKNILVTGASRGSICAEVLRLLLRGGARIIVTTSSYSTSVVQYFQELYTANGSRDSRLIVVPCNQGSVQDLQHLIEYIYDESDGLGWDLHHVLPFAAISEAGREVDKIDSKSELAHRIMLTNILRLLGEIKKKKQARGFEAQPTQVLLPLSPNHGIFGNDGLYAESKIALETLFEKWHSEHWSVYLSLCGVNIGWTRGTSLMAANDIFAAGLENKGVRTFSQAEMAFYVTSLMQNRIVMEGEIEPIKADLTGGLSSVVDLRAMLEGLRKDFRSKSELAVSIQEEEAIDDICINGVPTSEPETPTKPPKSNIHLDFPTLPDHAIEMGKLRPSMLGMVDLESVVVVTGFSEVGPYGNARTRWQMEADGVFSLEGCIELAWIMGLIKHHNGTLNGKHYIGWIDAVSSDPVQDSEVKAKYESHILEHTGIRLVEPKLQNGFDPNKQQLLQEIILEEDMPPMMVPKETADQVKLEHGKFADIFEVEGEEEWRLHIRKGATMLVPKALKFNRAVAGQIPTGWDARTYGIDESTVNQVDRVTLFALVSTVEALQASGIVDPYELYKYLHVSEIGNCISSGLGGINSLKSTFKTRSMDKPVQNDILQETFVNTTAAWVNMLLLSSSGPIRTNVGACATAIESLETGYETIVSKKAKLCLVGGVDDYGEAPATEFANMNATSNSDKEFGKGREPKQMSRPMSQSRSGFMESQGSGIQVLTSARLALDLGLPIYGIIAWVGTSSDKIGRSIPAPGQGVLTNAREWGNRGLTSPLLDIDFRRKRLDTRKQQIKEYLDTEIALAQKDLAALPQGQIGSSRREALLSRVRYVTMEAEKQTKAAQNAFGNNFWSNEPSIAPIRGALAVWNLTIDDLDFVSLHGTSTVMNDKNETNVIQQQMSHLGRKSGNTLYAITQKYLTGHSKGAAGAWMLNGALQAMDTGIIPGNRNADNIDTALAKNDFFVFPNRSIETLGLKAFSLTSFGFGQKGAQAIGVHPRYLYSTISQQEYEAYKLKTLERQRIASSYFQRALATNTIFVAKDHAPYTEAQQSAVLLNPMARATTVGNQHQFEDGLMEEDDLIRSLI